MVPFVRIAHYTPKLFNFALSAGTGGVVMPRIQDAKQAEELVRFARLPPLGKRSFPPAALINEQQNKTPQVQRTFDVWNNHAAVICQFEDLQGLENIEESTAFFVGTGDLRLCMDLASGSVDDEEPVFEAALQKIRDAAKAHKLPNIRFGLFPKVLKRRIDMGWTAFIIHADIDAIINTATKSLKSYSNAAYGSKRKSLENGVNGEQNHK